MKKVGERKRGKKKKKGCMCRGGKRGGGRALV